MWVSTASRERALDMTEDRLPGFCIGLSISADPAR